MIRGTTPTFTFTILSDDVDLTAAESVYVTIVQGGVAINKTGEALDVGEKTVECWLTQEESMQLAENPNADVQINWTYLAPGSEEVRRAATKIKSIPITKQLLKRVIE